MEERSVRASPECWFWQICLQCLCKTQPLQANTGEVIQFKSVTQRVFGKEKRHHPPGKRFELPTRRQKRATNAHAIVLLSRRRAITGAPIRNQGLSPYEHHWIRIPYSDARSSRGCFTRSSRIAKTHCSQAIYSRSYPTPRLTVR